MEFLGSNTDLPVETLMKTVFADFKTFFLFSLIYKLYPHTKFFILLSITIPTHQIFYTFVNHYIKLFGVGVYFALKNNNLTIEQ